MGQGPYMEKLTCALGREATVGYAARASAAGEGSAGVAPDRDVVVLRSVLDEVGTVEDELSEKRCLSRLTKTSRGRVTESAGEGWNHGQRVRLSPMDACRRPQMWDHEMR